MPTYNLSVWQVETESPDEAGWLDQLDPRDLGSSRDLASVNRVENNRGRHTWSQPLASSRIHVHAQAPLHIWTRMYTKHMHLCAHIHPDIRLLFKNAEKAPKLFHFYFYFKLAEVINANHEAVGHSGQDLHTDEKVLTLWEILQERR